MEFVNFLWFEHDPGVPTARRNDPSLLPGPGEYRWLDFNFDTNTPTGRTVHPGTGPWTPNDGGGFMRAILNGSETDLSPFLVHRQGKYLLYHGWADGLIGAEPTVDYYEGIVRDTFEGNAARAEANVRLFMVPGWTTAPAVFEGRRWGGTSSRHWSTGSKTTGRPTRLS